MLMLIGCLGAVIVASLLLSYFMLVGHLLEMSGCFLVIAALAFLGIICSTALHFIIKFW